MILPGFWHVFASISSQRKFHIKASMGLAAVFMLICVLEYIVIMPIGHICDIVAERKIQEKKCN
jgi:hypothetical protein